MIHSILLLFIGAPAPVPAPIALYQPWPACMITVPDMGVMGAGGRGMMPHFVPRQHLHRSARKSFCHMAAAGAVPAGMLVYG